MNTEPFWLVNARKYIGVAEIPGKDENPVIQRWLRELKSFFNSEDVPWCGTFCAAVFRESGLPVAKHWYRARDWLNWGNILAEPILGCVVVYERSGGGHVGFVVGRDVLGRIVTLGGNQGNRVSIAPFDAVRVLGYRWPEDRFAEQIAAGRLPMVSSQGQSSTGEA
jgi:uncharacterized protein (TIGR02594 family)